MTRDSPSTHPGGLPEPTKWPFDDVFGPPHAVSRPLVHEEMHISGQALARRAETPAPAPTERKVAQIGSQSLVPGDGDRQALHTPFLATGFTPEKPQKRSRLPGRPRENASWGPARACAGFLPPASPRRLVAQLQICTFAVSPFVARCLGGPRSVLLTRHYPRPSPLPGCHRLPSQEVGGAERHRLVPKSARLHSPMDLRFTLKLEGSTYAPRPERRSE